MKYILYRNYLDIFLLCTLFATLNFLRITKILLVFGIYPIHWMIVFTLICAYTIYLLNTYDRAVSSDESEYVSPTDGYVCKIERNINFGHFDTMATKITIANPIYSPRSIRSPITGSISNSNFIQTHQSKVSLPKISKTIGLKETRQISITTSVQLKVIIENSNNMKCGIFSDFRSWFQPFILDLTKINKGSVIGSSHITLSNIYYDVLLPANVEILVNNGQITVSGETVLARRVFDNKTDNKANTELSNVSKIQQEDINNNNINKDTEINQNIHKAGNKEATSTYKSNVSKYDNQDNEVSQKGPNNDNARESNNESTREQIQVNFKQHKGTLETKENERSHEKKSDHLAKEDQEVNHIPKNRQK